MSKKKNTAIRLSKGDRIMETTINIVMTLLFLIVLYPMVYVVSSSFSSGAAVNDGKVILWPVDFSTYGYEIVLRNPKVWIGYKNTIINTVLGTLMNVFTTTLVAYPLSRKDLQGKGFYSPYGGKVAADNSIERVFYVRGDKDAWLEENTQETCIEPELR